MGPVEAQESRKDWCGDGKSKYLAESYDKGLLLDELILFHPANAIMPKDAEKDLTKIVQRILGKDVYDQVVITSTMWDSIPNQVHTRVVQQEDRRKQPRGVWHSMCSQCAVVFRHDNAKPSADSIIRFLTSRPQSPFPVLMQEELSAARATWHQDPPARK